MGSVLDSIFSNFYMSDLENKILNSIKNLQYTKDMLKIYLFLLIILTKSTYYETPSKKIQFLNFTHELNKNNKISFLDVLIDTNNNNFTTFTYKKIL